MKKTGRSEKSKPTRRTPAPRKRKVTQPKKKGLPPQTVEGALRSFARQTIDLTPTDVAHARRSRTFLMQRLGTLRTKADIPRLTGTIIPFGSFARRTKIRPLDDIDLLVVIRGTDLATERWTQNTDVTLTPPAGSWPKKYLTPAGHLNSRVVLNGLKAHVASIAQYRNSVKRSSGQAVVLQPTTKDWVFDLVPAVAVRGGNRTITHYLIPNGKGAWMATDPRRDALNTRNVSAQVVGEMYATIRLVKFWNQRGGKPKLGSYHLETMALEGLKRQPFLSADPLDMLGTCLSYISQRVYHEYPDPKSLLGPIDAGLSFEVRSKVARAASRAAEHVRLASRSELSPREARGHLRKVFGQAFPTWVPRTAS